MKKRPTLSLISLVLLVGLIFAAFSACGTGNEKGTLKLSIVNVQ